MKKEEKGVVKPLSMQEQVETTGGYAPEGTYNPLNPKIPPTIPDLKELIICR